ncbi:MAG: AEC family transporter [Bacteroidota bacterium]
MESQVIAEQIIIAGIVVFAGAVGSWVKVINEQVKFSISQLVFNITLPLLILTTFSGMEMSREVLVNGFWVVVFSLVSFVVMHFFGKWTAFLFRLPERSAVVHELHTMFGNIVFLGFPLIAALFPQEESLLYASVYYMVSSFVQWTYAVYRLKGQKDVAFRHRFRHLLNPNTVAFLIGILLFFLQFRFPAVVHEPLKNIGSATSPLALLYIGASLTGTNIKVIVRRFDLYALSLNKLVVIPVVMLLIINFFIRYFGIELGSMARTIIVLETAMPCMSMIVIMARNYGAADDSASENVFLTTILSLLTLPFVYFLATSGVF